jgi:hypothetical protein
MIMMNVLLILANLNPDVSSTGMLTVMIITNAQEMNAYLLLDVKILKLTVMIIMLVLMIPAILIRVVNLPRLFAMIMTHVLMIPAALSMDVNILLDQ